MNNSSSDAILDLPTCSRIGSMLLTSAIALGSIAAFVGNSLVTITFLMNTTLRTSTNYFIVNMAVSDLLSSLTNWAIYATEARVMRKHMIEGPLANFVCKLGHYSRSVSQAVSILSLLLVVVDRYIAIVLPFKAIHVTRRLRAVLLLFTWIFPLLGGFPFVWSSKIIQKGHQTHCRALVSWSKIEQSIYYTVGFLTLYCVPLISVIILYSRIMKSLRQTRPGDEEQVNVRIRNRHQNQVVMKIFIWIVSTFFICWTPLCVYIVFKKLFPASYFAKDTCMLFVGLFFYVFPTLSTVVNPLILFASSSRFSNALRELFSFSCKPSQCCKGGRVSPH